MVGASPELHIEINEDNKAGQRLNVILTACLYPSPQEMLNWSCLVGRQMNLCLGRFCEFLSTFDALADLMKYTIGMYKSLNVFFIQKSPHLVTLTLTPLFIHLLCWFSDGLYSLPQKHVEKFFLKTDPELQGVPCLCFPDFFTEFCIGSASVF